MVVFILLSSNVLLKSDIAASIPCISACCGSLVLKLSQNCFIASPVFLLTSRPPQPPFCVGLLLASNCIDPSVNVMWLSASCITLLVYFSARSFCVEIRVVAELSPISWRCNSGRDIFRIKCRMLVNEVSPLSPFLLITIFPCFRSCLKIVRSPTCTVSVFSLYISCLAMSFSLESSSVLVIWATCKSHFLV